MSRLRVMGNCYPYQNDGNKYELVKYLEGSGVRVRQEAGGTARLELRLKQGQIPPAL